MLRKKVGDHGYVVRIAYAFCWLEFHLLVFVNLVTTVCKVVGMPSMDGEVVK